MTTYVALLRAVNVGGTGTVPMAVLRNAVAGLGYTRVRSLLQTGNLVFDANSNDTMALEARLAREMERVLGLTTTFFVRDCATWDVIVAQNPFPQSAADDPSHLLVMTCPMTPAPAAVEALRSAIVGREVVAVGDRCLYLVYPDGIGRSKLTNAMIERKLGLQGTARNWNTVLKIQAMARA